jgi:hypothetical protein
MASADPDVLGFTALGQLIHGQRHRQFRRLRQQIAQAANHRLEAHRDEMRVPGALLAVLLGHLVAAGVIPHLLDLFLRQGVEGAVPSLNTATA